MSALVLTEDSGPPMDALVDHLRDRRVLFVLDDCQHLLSAWAVLADTLLRACAELLRACAELRILATSREPLHGGTSRPAAGRELVPTFDHSA